MKDKIERITATIPMLLVMFIIYMFSGGTGEESGSLSLEISKEISKWFSMLGLDISADLLHLPVRKGAHMAEYATLAITTMWAFYGIKKRYEVSFSISVIYAITDEIHQRFVSGRCGTWKDVAVDSVGVCIGLMVYYLVGTFVKRKSNKNKSVA